MELIYLLKKILKKNNNNQNNNNLKKKKSKHALARLAGKTKNRIIDPKLEE